jgi:hypothetical protein
VAPASGWLLACWSGLLTLWHKTTDRFGHCRQHSDLLDNVGFRHAYKVWRRGSQPVAQATPKLVKRAVYGPVAQRPHKLATGAVSFCVYVQLAGQAIGSACSSLAAGLFSHRRSGRYIRTGSGLAAGWVGGLNGLAGCWLAAGSLRPPLAQPASAAVGWSLTDTPGFWLVEGAVTNTM